MDAFYKRYNKVLLDKLAIDKQKSTLEKENTDLKLQKVENVNAVGKVEAYEKVLFGSKKVTLE